MQASGACGVPGIRYVGPAEMQLEDHYAELSKFCEDGGTQRLAISGRAGPVVRAIGGTQRIPDTLQSIWSRAQQLLGLESEKLFQISVNHYRDASALMVPHKDGRGQLGLVFSFGRGMSTLKFFHRPLDSSATYTRVFDPPSADEVVHSYLLEPGSCLLVRGEAFTDWVHYVEKSDFDSVTESLANFGQLAPSTLKLGRVTRQSRVSVVMWPAGK